MMDYQEPILLDHAVAWRTYLGGSLLAKLHGQTGEDGHFPEEWIMSLVTARNAGREQFKEGLSHLAADPGLPLKSVIQNNPKEMLGSAHFKKYGATTGVLVKLIDSSERLTIQVHPDKQKAQELFHSSYGKTECWHILGGRSIQNESPCIYLGFKPGITRKRWKELFDLQDIRGMLDCLHRFEVKVGDTVLIQGGVPHAIGAGCFLTEIQEPTDFTIRTERTTPSGLLVADNMCHQGLGFDRMFDCFQYDSISEEEAKQRWFLTPHTIWQNSGGQLTALVGYKNTPFFAMNMAEVTDQMELLTTDIFSGLYILNGNGLICTSNKNFELAAGQSYFIPSKAGKLILHCMGSQPLRLLQFFGPQV